MGPEYFSLQGRDYRVVIVNIYNIYSIKVILRRDAYLCMHGESLKSR